MARAQQVSTLFAGDRSSLSVDERAAVLSRSFVFGDPTGQRIASVKRAWETAVLKAHGHTLEWTKGSNKLSPASRAALRSIDLHFHDLRHEAGSRWLEGGVALHYVQALLGHANLSQTSTYLNATRIGLHESIRRYEAGGARCNPVASEAAIDPPAICNTESLTEAKPLVN
jgi:integrase